MQPDKQFSGLGNIIGLRSTSGPSVKRARYFSVSFFFPSRVLVFLCITPSVVWFSSRLSCIGCPVSHLPQIIKSHVWGASYLTQPLHAHVSFRGFPGTAGTVRASCRRPPRGIVGAVASQDSGRGPRKGARGVQGPWASCSRVRGEGRQLPFNKGLFQPSHSLVVPKAQTRENDPETTIRTRWPFPAASVEAHVIPAPRPGHPPGECGASVLGESRLALELAAAPHPGALLTAGTVRAPGWALGVRGGGLCETRLSEGPVSAGRGGWCR